MPDQYDFVIMSLQAWDKPIGSNARDIALSLAQTHRVLFISPPLDWATKFRQRKQRTHSARTAGLVQVQSTLWVYYPSATLSSINWLPDGKIYDFFNWRNNRLLASEVQECIDQLDFNQVAFINDSDMFRGFYLKELLKPAIYVYYTRDNLLAVPFWKRHGLRLEPELMHKADLVVGNSTYLTGLASTYNTNAVYVGQGCELSQFDANVLHPLPDDLAAIPSPRIGYTGALTSLRLDLALLEKVARSCPYWQLVLIGPEDEAFRTSPLHDLSNVYFLGLKSPAELPAYLHHLDVLINPQLINDVTIGNYPRKIDEYLAMGKPVVAVRTDAMGIFKEHVLLASTADEFIDQLGRALLKNNLSTSAERVAFAKGHSWENSVALMLSAIQETMAITYQD
ncbi:glycosyltransferase [Spirosoma sp. BT704]|uniref:Glycosyltransferase n=2 Tax=Spirosoma validum TaxID=2771355 RepID=A0A927B6D9_9BACT|nr:glycosyltransferase [Spirosoma validum]